MVSILRPPGAIQILCPAHSCEGAFPTLPARGGKSSRGWIGRAKAYDPAAGKAKGREDGKRDEGACRAAGRGTAIDAPKKPYFCTHKDVS